MDLIGLASQFGGIAWTILAFLVVLGVVVFVHEYGHYIVGRWCGIHPEIFSIGFGKELYAWVDKRGTRWRRAALPLGGYVKFLGDADASSRVDTDLVDGMTDDDRARSFPGAPLWRRALTVAAGPFANFLLSIVLFTCIALFVGLATDKAIVGTVEDDPRFSIPFQPGDEIIEVEGQAVTTFVEVIDAYSEAAAAQPGRETYAVAVRRDGEMMELETGPVTPPLVASVRSGTPASRAGLMPGDMIYAINGERITAFRDLRDAVREADGAPLLLSLRTRDGAEREATLTAERQVTQEPNGEIIMRPIIGVTADLMIGSEVSTPGALEAVGYGFQRTWSVIVTSMNYLSAIITGQADASGLGGPIKIADLSGQAAANGFFTFVQMIALISTSIGLINLFPIPVLDGGHLLFYAAEAVRGKPLGNRFVEAATGLGLGIVILLMVFVTYNDIVGL